MKPEQLRDQALLIEGFKNGYNACLQWIAQELAKEGKEMPVAQMPPEDPKTVSN